MKLKLVRFLLHVKVQKFNSTQATNWSILQKNAFPKDRSLHSWLATQRYIFCKSYDFTNYCLTKKLSKDGGAGALASPILVKKPLLCQWKLASPVDGENGLSEEVVLRAQGVLCQKDLPPILRPINA